MTEEDVCVIPSEIVKETDRYSIVESDWGGDKMLEVYLKEWGVCVRITDDPDYRYFVAIEPYECEQCEKEAGNKFKHPVDTDEEEFDRLGGGSD